MKNIKKMIMGTAAIMSILTIGSLSVSAQEATPQKADFTETVKAAQSVTIDTNTESDKFSIIAAGSVTANESIIELVSENDTPIKADTVEADKAAESITIDLNTENDAFSIIAAGNAEASEDVCVISGNETESIDVTNSKVSIKQDKENNKFMISWDNGETWYEMDIPMAADSKK